MAEKMYTLPDIPMHGCDRGGMLPWLAAVGAAVTLESFAPFALYWNGDTPTLRPPPPSGLRVPPWPVNCDSVASHLTTTLCRQDREVWYAGKRRQLTADINEIIQQSVTTPEERRTVDLLGVLTTAAWPAHAVQPRCSMWVGGFGQQDFWRKARGWCEKTSVADIFQTLFGQWQWTKGGGLGWHPQEDAFYLGHHCRGAYRLALEGLRIIPPTMLTWDDETGTNQLAMAGWRNLAFRYPCPTSPVSIDTLRSLMQICWNDEINMDVAVYEVRLRPRQTNRRYLVVSPPERVY